MTVLINRHKKNAQSYAIILIGLAIGLASWFTGGFGYFKTIETDAAGGPDVACIGNAVANYIDAVMAGIGSTPGVPNSDDLPNIRTLSPVFNMTSPYFQDMVNTMAGSSVYWGSLDAIGGNAYNFQNGPYIPDWVATARTNPNIGNRPMILTEIGWYELLQGSDIGTARTNLGNSASWINSQSNILGSMLFNVFNTNGVGVSTRSQIAICLLFVAGQEIVIKWEPIQPFTTHLLTVDFMGKRVSMVCNGPLKSLTTTPTDHFLH